MARVWCKVVIFGVLCACSSKESEDTYDSNLNVGDSTEMVADVAFDLKPEIKDVILDDTRFSDGDDVDDMCDSCDGYDAAKDVINSDYMDGVTDVDALELLEQDQKDSLVAEIMDMVTDADTCLPACDGLECGDDGCGGECGECPIGQNCEQGQCLAAFCLPDCEQRQCGGDGCGGSCGVCSSGWCSPVGICVVPDVPAGWLCPPSQWNDGGFCDCSCGVLDADCWYEDFLPVVGCDVAETCTPSGVCAGALPAWTLALFINGDNDLQPFALGDVDELMAVGSTDQVRILAMVDTRTGPAETYLIENGSAVLLHEDGELDLSDWETLRDFAVMAFSSYPAQHYGLIIWNHGSGWRLHHYGDSYKGVSSDDSGQSGEISVAKGDLGHAMFAIAHALGRKLDFLGFDACLMGSWEVADTVAPYADWMVGSEELEPGTGWTYTSFLQDLLANPDWTPADLAVRIVETYYEDGSENSTLSAIDLAGILALSAAVTKLAESMFEHPEAFDLLDLVRASTLGLSNDTDANERSFRDLGHLAASLESFSMLPQDLRDRASDVSQRLADAVILSLAQSPDYEQATGLSIHFPSRDVCMNHSYSWAPGASWASGGTWDDFLAIWSLYDCGPWVCDGDWYGGEDGCDCNCGSWDPDCDNPEEKVYHCGLGQTCAAPGVCEGDIFEVCAEWTCPAGYFGGHDGCDCLCGCFDPDCEDPKQQVINCELGQTCSMSGECEGEPIVVCDGWTCDTLYFGMGDGCDCDCGCRDPDCNDPEADLWNCEEGQVCSDDGLCVTPPENQVPHR